MWRDAKDRHVVRDGRDAGNAPVGDVGWDYRQVMAGAAVCFAKFLVIHNVGRRSEAAKRIDCFVCDRSLLFPETKPAPIGLWASGRVVVDDPLDEATGRKPLRGAPTVGLIASSGHERH